jgi:hypothetical protein
VVLAGIFFLSLLSLVDEAIPFLGGGIDDEGYFTVSKRSFNRASDWFDLGQFKRTHEQAGYPMLLSWVHQFVGDSLYHRKAVNVFFLMLALVWFEIGKQMGADVLGFVFASGILLTTPLWYYWDFPAQGYGHYISAIRIHSRTCPVIVAQVCGKRLRLDCVKYGSHHSLSEPVGTGESCGACRRDPVTNGITTIMEKLSLESGNDGRNNS